MSAGWGLLAAALLATAPQPADYVELQAQQIESALVAPCCFRQQVSVHSSAAADDVRRDVRARLAAGQSRQDILDFYVAQYGKRILAEPPPEGAGIALRWAPVVIGLAGLGLLVVFLRQVTGRMPRRVLAGAGLDAGASLDEQVQLDEALRDLD